MAGAFSLSLAHATLLHVSPPDLIRVAATAGYDMVGLRLMPIDRPGEPRWAPAEHPSMLAETRRALAETGLRVLDIEVVQLRDDLSVNLPVLEAAAELGARFVLVNLYTPDQERGDELLASLCDLARPLGLTLALEFVSFSDLKTLDAAVATVLRVQRDNTGVLLDTLHFHASGAPASDLSARACSRLVGYIHLCDGPADRPTSADDRRRVAREARLLPGEGGMDLISVLRRLPPGTVYAVEAPNPVRARALGADQYARLAHEKTMTFLTTIGQ